MKMVRQIIFFALLIKLFLPSEGTNCDERYGEVNKVPEGSAPYMVSLRNSDLQHICGGSILNRRWLLTSAKCVYGKSNYTAVVGSNALLHGGTIYQIQFHITHPEYSEEDGNDIALVRVGTNIEFTDTIQPITLSSRVIGNGVEMSIIGWSFTNFIHSPNSRGNDLQMIKVKSVTKDECLRVSSLAHWHSDFCGVPKTGQGSCRGDDGGAVVVNNLQVGLVCSALDPCLADYPDCYTRLSAYIGWIEATIISI